MDQNKIFYNGIDLFSGIAPTPFVALNSDNISYASRWGASSSISLVGQITGQCLSFSGFVDKQKILTDRLSKNFQPFVIYEGATPIMSGDSAIIKKISFEESKYFSIVPFTIDVEIYNKDMWSGYFGIVDPVNELSMEDGEDGTLSIKHSVSAKGFNTSVSAFDNAKNWVMENSGIAQGVSPAFCQFHSYSPPFLASFSESINRLDGSYGIVENYKLDTKNIGDGVLRYTVDTSYTESDGLTTVSIKGSIVGGIGQMDSIRSRMEALDLYSMAFDQYNRATGGEDLSPYEIDKKIDENENSKTIRFEVSYNNDPAPVVFPDYTVDISNQIEDGSVEVTLVADIICSHGHPRRRYQECLDYFTNSFNPTALAKAYFDISAPIVSGNPFLYEPAKKSTTHRPKDGDIKYTSTWVYPDPSISFSADIALPKPQYTLSRPLCSSWLAAKTGFSLGTLSIRGKAVGIDALAKGQAAIEQIKAMITFTSCYIYRKKTNTKTSSSNPYEYEFEEVWELKDNTQ